MLMQRLFLMGAVLLLVSACGSESDTDATARQAVGAQVVLRCGSTTITRDLFPANGFMGQSPAELVIGVGQATTIDQLVIRWPTGEAQTFANLPVDGRLRIVEGQQDYHWLSF